MAEQTLVEGVALAYVEREYRAFTDRVTGEQRPGGITAQLWIGKGMNDEPVIVKVPDALRREAAGIERGVSVRCTVGLFARDSQISYVLSALAFPVAA